MSSQALKNTGCNAIGSVVDRLNTRPANNLSNEAYHLTVEAGWDDQWLNWDDLGDDDPGWGDIGD